MKTFAAQPVMLEDADLDYVTGGLNVGNNSTNSVNNSFNNTDIAADNTNSAVSNSFNS